MNDTNVGYDEPSKDNTNSYPIHSSTIEYAKTIYTHLENKPVEIFPNSSGNIYMYYYHNGCYLQVRFITVYSYGKTRCNISFYISPYNYYDIKYLDCKYLSEIQVAEYIDKTVNDFYKNSI